MSTKTAAHHHENLKSHAKALIHATGHIADTKVSEARGKLSEVLDSISDSVAEAEHFAIEKTKQGDAFIKAHPYQTAGIALGVGAVLGFLFSRRGK